MPNGRQKRTASAAANPTSEFDAPRDVVGDASLSDAAKKRILDTWEEDARRLAVATEEGMAGGEPSRLDEVAEAKADLGLASERRPTPTKSG